MHALDTIIEGLFRNATVLVEAIKPIVVVPKVVSRRNNVVTGRIVLPTRNQVGSIIAYSKVHFTISSVVVFIVRVAPRSVLISRELIGVLLASS